MKTKQVKRITGVVAVMDAQGKTTAILHRPGKVMGLPGWKAVRGTFVPNKRQASR